MLLARSKCTCVTRVRAVCVCIRWRVCARGDKAADVILRVGSPRRKGQSEGEETSFKQCMRDRDVRVRLLFAFSDHHLALDCVRPFLRLLFFAHPFVFSYSFNLIFSQNSKSVVTNLCVFAKFVEHIYTRSLFRNRDYEIPGNGILTHCAEISSEIIQLNLHPGSYVLSRGYCRLAIKSSVKS